MSDPDGATALAICGSQRGYAVALCTRAGIVHTGAGDELTALVAAALDRHGVELRGLEELRVDLGPGSYTGLRVATTFARTLAWLGEIPVRVATSLELIAAQATPAGDATAPAALRVVLDARRERYHHARLEVGARIALVGEPAATTLQDLCAALRPDEVVVGDAALREALAARVVERGATWREVEVDAEASARALFDARVAPRAAQREQLTPLYLMGSYAE